MPYPKPSDPQFCVGSGETGIKTKTKFGRCRECGRLIKVRKNGTTLPHSKFKQPWDPMHEVLVELHTAS